MKVRTLASLLALGALALALPAAASADPKVASATGVTHAGGEKYFVDVLVAVPSGQSAREATDRALAQQGAARAKPGGGGGGYSYTGLKWSAFPVVQNYNSTGEPAGLGASSALQDTQATWSNVSGSTFRMSNGAATTRCPSLVNECPGKRFGDQRNDVGWLSLSGGTLGVTWWTTSTPEADMALNTRFAWKNTCTSSGTGYDVETVFLHENGHVAGLGHTNNTASIMYPSYQTAQCSLFPYDQQALAALY